MFKGTYRLIILDRPAGLSSRTAKAVRNLTRQVVMVQPGFVVHQLGRDRSRALGMTNTRLTTPLYKTSTGHFGSALIKARPYGFVTIRLSRITMMP